ncbi:MAG: hypothetical protein Fur0018_10430 [Anaerolineales bacterium]
MFREFSVAALGGYVFLTALWVCGGALIGRFGLHLRRAEALAAGLALGFVSVETLANAGAHFLSLPAAFWLAAVLVFALGVAAWRASGWERWPLRGEVAPALALAVLLALLFPIQRGLALFDEFLHIPMVAIMARDAVPPPFYLDPSLPFAYHYGLHVWAASLVRMAGLFPWAALDLGKALTIALSTVLGWLWFYRSTHSRTGAWWGAAAAFFGGGVRWLLLFLPHGVLAWLDGHVTLAGSAADTATAFSEALSRPWLIEGGGQVPFPFAFHSGFFTPLHLAMANTAALSWMTVLALLLAGERLRRAHWSGWIAVLLAFASLALSAEHLFVTLAAGVGLAGLFFALRRRRWPHSVLAWGLTLTLSGALSLWQGGYITEVLRAAWLRWQGQAVAQANAYGFALRWPAAIPTAHFGALSVFDPAQLLVLLTEFGPVLFLLPAAWLATRRYLSRSRWVAAGLALAGWGNLWFGLLVRYGLDRSMTRMPETAARIWLLLGWPLAWGWFVRRRDGWRMAAQAALGAGMFGGVLLFALALTSKPQPQMTYFVESTDVLMSQRFWDVLPVGAQVLDATAPRSVALFGWPVRAYEDIYRPYPAWNALIARPAPQAVAAAGYDFVYMDEVWWRHIPTAIQQAYDAQDGCVRRMGGEGAPPAAWRALYDVRSCR